MLRFSRLLFESLVKAAKVELKNGLKVLGVIVLRESVQHGQC